MNSSRKPQRAIKHKESVYVQEHLFVDDITKMKTRLINLDPSTIIEEALKTCHSNEAMNKRKYQNLETIKQQAMVSINDVLNRNQTTAETNDIYKQKVSEYQTSTDLIVGKKEQEREEYLGQLQSIKEKHSDLTIQKAKMQLETKKLVNQLNESKRLIDTLILKYELIDKMMPLFELVLKEFETDDPQKVIIDISRRLEQEKECHNEINDLNNHISDKKKEKKKDYWDQKQKVEELSKKLFDTELANKDRSEKYEEEARGLKEEIKSNMKHQVTHLLMQNMLSSFFNLIHPKLNLEQGVKKSETLPTLLYEDYHSNVSDNEEISRYINNMLLSSDPSNCGKLLRSIVAYSNMMLRKRIKAKVNEKYDPEFTFGQMEKLIKENDDQNKKLKNIIEVKQEKIRGDKAMIEQLENEIKNQNEKYDNLQNYVNTQLMERIKTSKNDRKLRIRRNSIKKYHFAKPLSPPRDSRDEIKRQSISRKTMSRRSYQYNDYLFKQDNECLTEINNKKKAGEELHEIYFDLNNERKPKKNKRPIQKIPPDVMHEIQGVIDHTNRLFFYKTKQKKNTRVTSPMDRIESKLAQLTNIQKGKSKPTEISDNILHHLDNIIYSIEKQDKQ